MRIDVFIFKSTVATLCPNPNLYFGLTRGDLFDFETVSLDEHMHYDGMDSDNRK